MIPTALGNETILLVEDEPSILKMTKKMLQLLGYNVLTAGRPGEAIDLVRFDGHRAVNASRSPTGVVKAV